MMTKDEMLEQFDVLGFAYGWAIVRRKSDGKEGTLDFAGAPRFYFNFQEA